MPLTRSRYDGHADWYDAWNLPHAERYGPLVRDLLGAGDGLCLDLGCGSGHYAAALAATGRTVVGLDRSIDQCHTARRRCHRIIQADAGALPFAASTFSAVAALWVSTDVDDFHTALADAARVLIPDGLLLFCGPHPCFNGPHSQRMDDGVLAHAAYRDSGWHPTSPWWGDNVRGRVGMRHLPLAELINAFIRTGLTIENVAELGDQPIPTSLAVRARKRIVS
jgi:SAM-dependent methyltransferase